MDVSLSELKAFARVADLGNLTRAARTLNVTQPSLSWSIRKLEENLGTKLFHRSQKGMVLTRAGSKLLDRSRDLMRSWEGIGKSLSAEQEEVEGRYRLGVHGTVAIYNLPLFAPKLLLEYPGIELELVHDRSTRLAEAVINYRIDFGIIVNPPRHEDLTVVELYKDEIVFYTSIEPGPLQDLDRETSVVLMHPRMIQSEPLYREALRRGVFKAQRVLHTTELELNTALVGAGAGFGLLPGVVTDNHPEKQLVPVPDSPVHEEIVALVYRKDAVDTLAGRTIRDVIVACLSR